MAYKAVIIGATSGIGLEVARMLWKEGATVGVAGRRTGRLQEFCNECGQRVHYLRIDITDNDAGKKLIELSEAIGGADMILLCSGTGSQDPELKPEIESDTVNTNVGGFTRMIDAAFNYFKGKGGGHIAAVTSIAGTKGLGIAAAYSATKRYQNTYMQCLAQLSAMQGYNIRFTDIRPGFVDTDLLKSGSFPMKMPVEYTAKKIVKAIKRHKRVAVIDWKYKIIVAIWRIIPNCIWERMNIRNQ